MNTLEVSPRDRILSRISFYLLVCLVMWMTNALLPDLNAIEEAKWEAQGVVRPMFAVPISELPFPSTPTVISR